MKPERLAWSGAITAWGKRPLLIPSLLALALWVVILFVAWVMWG